MDAFLQVLENTLNSLVHWFEASGPKLLAALLIVIVGWILSKLVKVGVVKVLRTVKFDVLTEKAGIEAFLQRGNLKADSVEILGRLVYWLLLLLSLLLAITTMGLAEANVLLAGVLAVMPRVILAVFVLLLGLSFAGFIADVVQTATANAGFKHARLLSNVSRYAVTILVVIMALNQLEVGTEVIGTAFLILFGAICLAGSLAFGLGCRDLAGQIAEDLWRKEREQVDALAKARPETEPPVSE